MPSRRPPHAVHRARFRRWRAWQLIDDILDLSKMEAGKLRIHRGAGQPACAGGGGIADVRAGGRAGKPLPLVPVIDAGLAPAHMDRDPLRLKQILGNLVSNAIRFTDHGEVRVHLRGEAGTRWRTGDRC
ncbi:hypothetical protein ACTMU2_20360 [Cupriavidus basilensis]